MANIAAAIGRLRVSLTRAEVFWTTEIWSPEVYARRSSIAGRGLILGCRALYILVSGFRRERIKLRAAALTYTSLLSLVPALAVGFSIFAAFGGLAEVRDTLQQVIIDALSVTHREKITEFLELYVGNVHAAKIGGFGVVVLFFTVVSLLTNIERAFNDIWGLRRDRALIQRFQVYWPLVTLGPVFLGLSVSIGTGIQASETFRAWVETLPHLRYAIGVGPLLLAAVFFSFLYKIMPNTRVPARFAMLGGFMAGALWFGAQWLFGLYAARAITYASIYGQLAAVPLFILWVYVSWVVTLAGAQLAFAAQSATTYQPESAKNETRFSQREREVAALRILSLVAQRYERGEGPAPEEYIRAESGVEPRLALVALEALIASALLVEAHAVGTAEDDTGYVPARPPSTISAADVVVALRSEGQRDDSVERLPQDPVAESLRTLLDREREAVALALGPTCILDVTGLSPDAAPRGG